MRHVFRKCRPVLCLVLLVTVAQIGCDRYGEVSPRAYEISSSLYSICNRHDAARIAAVETVINESHAAAEITATEQEWLLEIVEKARADEWTIAMQDARVMMMEQVQN